MSPRLLIAPALLRLSAILAGVLPFLILGGALTGAATSL